MLRPRSLLPLLTAACALPPAGAEPPAPSDLRPAFAAYGLAPRGQGPRPTCSIFTTVAAFEFACARATGRGERLSVEYANWAANAATGRTCDGDFFHHALTGYERFGLCPEAAWPYAERFDVAAMPTPDALVAGGRRQAGSGARLRVRWIRPNDGTAGLSPAQFDDVVATLARGWPVAAGSGHSRLLVGFTPDATAAGGGTFATLDSALARFDAVPAAFVRGEVNDAFVVELAETAR
ncbi:MAG: hypothetical protein JNL08_16830 [Planctomycetes bacterium]|nr:hypothetical protein [Planctomycetota bacterium]